MAQDDSDILEAALKAIHGKGCLVLRRRVEINGIGFAPGSYVLQHVGPVPADEMPSCDKR